MVRSKGRPARIAAAAALVAMVGAITPAMVPVARAQQVLEGTPALQADGPMLLEADTLRYNVRTEAVTARGNVFVGYQGYQLFTSRLSYDPKTRTLSAAGGVRLEEPEGNIVVAREMVLSKDLRDGFIAGLRADTIYRTRLAANRAERTGSVTIFENAAYTACWSCRRRPDQPPTWQIKARRIVVDEEARTLTFEGPQVDLFGASSPTLPSFTIPDPRVQRRSGVLPPTFVYSNLIGLGMRVPYVRTIGDSADITAALTPLSRQGVFGDVEFRQRTVTGAWMVRAIGINQIDPGAFDNASGDRRLRGAVTTRGEFWLNPRWRYGWESMVSTDRRILSDYKQSDGNGLTAPTTAYLSGLGERNHFDARFWAFRVLQDDFRGGDVADPPAPFSPVGRKLQGKQAYVHPVIDYEGVYDRAVMNGELSYRFNLTSLSRQETDAFGAIENGVNTARFRGVSGTFTRGSGEVAWRRQLIGPLGQVLTPRVAMRGDLFAVESTDRRVTALTDDPLQGRVTPSASLNWRWPWLVTQTWGTQTVEPVAEIHARPSEILIGDLPNEDAQSVVFDTTNLFGPTRFSGYDRAEGGVRANVGLRYTVQTFSGGFVSATVGQSYHLAGRNSYRVPDILDSTAGSGLDKDVSDVVAGLTMDTNAGFTMAANGRFDDETFDVERAELSASARAGPLSTNLVYAYLAEQPALGFLEDRAEVQGAASLRVFDRTRLFGLLRYDLSERDVIRSGAGLGYDDDALSVSLAFSEDRGGAPDEPADRTVFFRVGLRTIGNAGLSTGLEN